MGGFTAVWKLITHHPVPFGGEDVALNADDLPSTPAELDDDEGVRQSVSGVRILAREAATAEAIASRLPLLSRLMSNVGVPAISSHGRAYTRKRSRVEVGEFISVHVRSAMRASPIRVCGRGIGLPESPQSVEPLS